MTDNPNFKIILLILFCIQGLLFLISIPFHSVNGDEAWSAEQSYSLAKNGVSTSNLFKGMIKEDQERIVVQHKLFIYTSALLFSILGLSLNVIRIIPIISFLALLYLLFLFLKRENLFDKKYSIYLLVLLLLSFSEFFYFAKIARPEMMVTIFGFASYYFISKKEDKKTYLHSIIGGIFAGAAMLTHLYGIVFVVSGIAFLLYKRKYKYSVLFLIFSLIVFLPYIVDIILYQDIFKAQIMSPLVNSKTSFNLITPLINFFKEHERLFRKPEIIFSSLLTIFCIVINFKDYRKNHNDIIIYTIILIISIALIVEDKTIKYSVYLIPFQATLIYICLRNFSIKNKVVITSFCIVIVLFFAVSFNYNIRDTFNKEYISKINNEISELIPEGSWVIAPMNYIFNGIEKHKIVSTYLLRIETNNNITFYSLFNFCNNKKIDYVIFNKYGENVDIPKDYQDKEELIKYFEIVNKNQNYEILKIKKIDE